MKYICEQDGKLKYNVNDIKNKDFYGYCCSHDNCFDQKVKDGAIYCTKIIYMSRFDSKNIEEIVK